MPLEYDVEIFGLAESTHERSCNRHAVCGEQVDVGSLIRVKFSIIDGPNGIEEALPVVVIVNGEERCRVGFLPNKYLPRKDELVEKFAQVCEVYDCSESRYRRQQSSRNGGMAKCAWLEHIPYLE
uniref:HIRAN domain-containing protein n=1 Tax=Spongospora subterranea TaxID=70186 RepID=A0A0H5R5P5_9EUKA|eukprot:CRZ09453.1 hypothetical protein [Spongospora subterranea]